jgi:hypothetical protein
VQIFLDANYLFSFDYRIGFANFFFVAFESDRRVAALVGPGKLVNIAKVTTTTLAVKSIHLYVFVASFAAHDFYVHP